MATIDRYKIKIDVDGEEQIRDLQSDLDVLGARFAAIGTAGLAAFAALAKSAVTMADTMVDVANATGISAAKILQLNTALEASGGQFGSAGTLLRGFTNSLDDINKGSKTAIASLNQLGLSSDQLKRLSGEEAMQAVINALGKMQAGLERNRLGMEFFGRAADGVDWTQMAQGTSKAVDPQLEARLRTAADAVGQMESAFREMQIAALGAVTPILQAIGNLNFTAEDAKKTIQVLGALIAGAFSAAVLTQVLRLITAFKTLVATLRAAATAQAFLTALIPGGLALVAAAGAAATAAYIALGKAIDGASNEAQRFSAISSDLDNVSMTSINKYSEGIKKLQKQLKEGSITQDEFNRRAAQLETQAKTPSGAPASSGGGSSRNLDNQRQLVEQIKQQTQSMVQQLAIQNQFRRAQIELLGVEGSRGNLLRQNLDLEQQFALESLDYAQRIQEEYAKGAGSNKDVIDYLRQQLLIKRDQLTAAKDLNAQEEERIRLQQRFATSVEAATNMLDLFKDRAIFEMYLNTLGKIGIEYDRSIQKLSLYEQATNNLFGILKNIISLGKEDLGSRGIFSIQRAVNDFSETLLKAYENVDFGSDAFNLQLIVIKRQLLPAINALKTELKKYVKEGSEEQINALIEQMNIEAMRHAQRMDNLDAENKKQDEITSSFAAGLKQGLVQVAESISPFRIALDSVNSVISGIDNALTEFVKNGKFNFKDFAQSILADMALIIARALVMRAILAIVGVISPGAGAALQTAMAFGGARAKGGPVLPGRAYLVGEKGPELAMFDRPGTIVPNNQLAMAGGGSTNVTYNINAVDASSFRSLVARDPQFIYNVTEVGRRSNPARRLA